MNGKFLLDTNAVIALLNGNAALQSLLLSANWVGISVITELEFLAFPNLSSNDSVLFRRFKQRVEVIGIDASDTAFLEQTIQIRRDFNVKLPDAVVATTALQNQSTLLSNDAVFRRLPMLSLQNF
ncbi:MAG: type II toxin-antitoxin system VapC family toxin [Saprospiraceae bacterium]